MRTFISVNRRDMLRWVDKNSGDWPSSAYFDTSRIAWDSLEKLPDFRPDMHKVMFIHFLLRVCNRFCTQDIFFYLASRIGTMITFVYNQSSNSSFYI